MIEYRRRRPPLYRLARYLRWCAVLALFIVLVFLASTIFSAVKLGTGLNPTTGPNGGYAFHYSPALGYTVSFGVNLTNDGYYPLVLDLSAVAYTPLGTVIPYTSTGAVTFSPGNTTTEFGLTVRIPQSTLMANAGQMLVRNTPIAGNVWFNGTYAWIYQFGFSVSANGTWGAPFENLTIVPGTPTAAAGQTTVPVSIRFTNNAFFADVGNLTLQVVNGGTDCGGPSTLAVDVPSQQSFTGLLNLTGPSTCMVPGATVTATYTVGPLTVPLPSTRIG